MSEDYGQEVNKVLNEHKIQLDQASIEEITNCVKRKDTAAAMQVLLKNTKLGLKGSKDIVDQIYSNTAKAKASLQTPK
jgi:hypothetical protein